MLWLKEPARNRCHMTARDASNKLAKNELLTQNISSSLCWNMCTGSARRFRLKKNLTLENKSFDLNSMVPPDCGFSSVIKKIERVQMFYGSDGTFGMWRNIRKVPVKKWLNEEFYCSVSRVGFWFVWLIYPPLTLQRFLRLS